MKKKHGCFHHIIATSIGGKDKEWTLFSWEREAEHIAWHELFKNFSPSVCIRIILGWCDGNENREINLKKMGKINIKAWNVLFNHKTPEEAVEFIKEKLN